MSYWEPVSDKAGAIGCAVLLPTPAAPVPLPEQTLLKTTVKRGQTLVYFAGAGWTRGGDFADQAAWEKYVSDFAAKTAIAPNPGQ